MTYILINVITALSIFQARQRGKRCKCESEKLCFAPHRNVLKAKKKKQDFRSTIDYMTRKWSLLFLFLKFYFEDTKQFRALMLANYQR